MKTFQIAVLGILVFLAVSSGITKILLMPNDVEFFGKYGFTRALLVVFGAAQLVGGVMMVIFRTRLLGAAIVSVTFLVSAILLIMEENVPFTIATLVSLVFLGFVAQRNLRGRSNTSN